MTKILYNSEDEEDISEQEQEIKNIQDAPSSTPPAPSLNLSKNRKKIINSNIPDEIIDDKPKFKCELCNKEFARNAFLQKHINELRCNVKREQTKKVEDELNDLKNKLDVKLQRKNAREQEKLEQKQMKEDFDEIKIFERERKQYEKILSDERKKNEKLLLKLQKQQEQVQEKPVKEKPVKPVKPVQQQYINHLESIQQRKPVKVNF